MISINCTLGYATWWFINNIYHFWNDYHLKLVNTFIALGSYLLCVVRTLQAFITNFKYNTILSIIVTMLYFRSLELIYLWQFISTLTSIANISWTPLPLPSLNSADWFGEFTIWNIYVVKLLEYSLSGFHGTMSSTFIHVVAVRSFPSFLWLNNIT